MNSHHSTPTQHSYPFESADDYTRRARRATCCVLALAALLVTAGLVIVSIII